ncbi:MAG TPA: hypothetical protein PKA00_08215 [Saprospiraceae bacterium]|nr:hypothetical protein [Saprospiraceae bacterium]HMQ82878.1 hypothetical protein [Saprospiraceae bacterium]
MKTWWKKSMPNSGIAQQKLPIRPIFAKASPEQDATLRQVIQVYGRQRLRQQLKQLHLELLADPAMAKTWDKIRVLFPHDTIN